MLEEDVASSQDLGQTTILAALFPGLDSFFLLTFLSHSITLIVLSSEEGTSELRLERLLQMVFGAMVRLPRPLLQTKESELSASFSLRPSIPAPNIFLLQNLGILAPSPSSLRLMNPDPQALLSSKTSRAPTLLYGSSRFFLWDLKN